MIIFGLRASNIGNYKVSNSKCEYCQEGNTQKVSVFGRYAHVFWIPAFPLGTKAVAECTHCKRTLEQKEFNPALRASYPKIKKNVKRPIWHWTGTGIFALLLISFIALVKMAGSISDLDSRSALLSNDEDLMVSNPSKKRDPISYKIKKAFDNFALDEVKPEQFKYLTKVKGNKALILVQIPKLRKVKRKNRIEALQIVEMVTEKEAFLEGKEIYIGIKGGFTMMLIKTPTYNRNSKLADITKLYDFYGPKRFQSKNNDEIPF